MDNDAAIVLATPDGLVRHWNERATALFGHAADEVLGESMEKIIPPPYRDRHWAAWRRAWDRGELNEYVATLPVRCADGEVRRFAGRLLPIRAPHGDPVAVMGVFTAPSDKDETLFPFPDGHP